MTTDQTYTHIAFILDRSGSMTTLADDTMGGYNSFLAEQRKLPGKCTFTLATFSSDYTLVHDFLPLSEVPNLTSKTYQTSGFTSLLDAVGSTINSVGAKLAALPEHMRPGKVIVVVATDGKENRSKEFNLATIKSMIDHQINKYNWLVVYSGTGLDQFHDQQGQSLGVSSFNTVKYAASAGGTRKLYESLNVGMSNYRAQDTVDSSNYSFFDPSHNTTVKPAVEVQPIIVVDTPASPITPGDSTTTK
jgi:hypothetical protein